MPLIVGVQAPPPPPTQPGFEWPQPWRLLYVDPDGEAWNFSDLAGQVQVVNVAGIGSPPVALTSLALPSGGMIPQNYIGTGRTIIAGIVFGADTQAEFMDLQDRLAYALWTERNGEPAPGTLIVQRPDGRARQIRVLVTGGPDQADDDRDKSGLTWASFPVTFRSTDAYWSDATPTVLEFAGPPGGAGVPPMPPVLLTPNVALGSATVTNSGNAPAYPLWTVVGPGVATFTNVTTGREFGLDVTLGSGEVITINTGPDGEAYAIDQLGADRWGDLVKSSPRDLWPLVKGDNELELVIASGDSNSRIVLSYVRRWLRA